MKIGKARIVSLLVILFSLFMIYQTTQIESVFAVSAKDAGPKLFPFFTAGGMLLCAIGKFITEKETDDTVFFSKEGWLKVLVALALFAVYIVAMEKIGFLIVTPFMLFAMVLLIAGKKKINRIVAVVFSLALTAFVYFVFYDLMHVMLPSGTLFR